VGPGRFIAGGTDLLVQMRAGRRVDRLIDLTNLVDGPPPVAWKDGRVEVSALASISRVVKELGGRLPAISASARLFGSLQIRNRATIGGNLANASPAGDMIPPLVASGAEVEVAGPSGSRHIPVGQLHSGPGKTVLGEGEMIKLVAVPLPEGEEGFLKVGGRQAMFISVVSLAWRWTRRDDGALADVRLALGAVAPTVRRAPAAEAVLEASRPSPAVTDRAVAALQDDISPIDDVRASAWYRRELAGALLRQALGR
jgi:CO/xanthine dehydrogenase FAD-binding subunit